MNAQAKVEKTEAIEAGYDDWREALCQFYERDELRQKAENLRRGYDFDYLDIRAIDALKAAVEAAPIRKVA